jgi:adenylosuccinate synthase
VDAIRAEWTPARLAKLGVIKLTGAWAERLTDDVILEHFIDDCRRFSERIIKTAPSYLSGFDELIFEGAQGLLLDQNDGFFPHVTRSNTGVRNAAAIAESIGLEELDVFYLTRAYVTRHGAGPLPHELQEKPYSGIVDRTNLAHPYQGSLRFAWFDLDLFRNAVLRDLKTQSLRLRLNQNLGMSCLDQVDGAATYIDKSVRRSASAEGLVEAARRAIGAKTALAGWGPTRKTVYKTDVNSGFGRINSILQTLDVEQSDRLVAVR